MAICINKTRTNPHQVQNRECAADLSGLQYCAVSPTGGATGVAQATTPTQGSLCYGIQQNIPVYADGDLSEIIERGYSQARCYETFNAGVELTPHDLSGRLEEAHAGDYVIAYAEEASTCMDAIITVRVIDPYQKNA